MKRVKLIQKHKTQKQYHIELHLKGKYKDQRARGKDTYFIVVRVIMVGVRGKRRGRSKDSDKETEGRDREEVEEEEEGSPGSCALLPHHYC